jgi:hypothetical protein
LASAGATWAGASPPVKTVNKTMAAKRDDGVRQKKPAKGTDTIIKIP